MEIMTMFAPYSHNDNTPARKKDRQPDGWIDRQTLPEQRFRANRTDERERMDIMTTIPIQLSLPCVTGTIFIESGKGRRREGEFCSSISIPRLKSFQLYGGQGYLFLHA